MLSAAEDGVAGSAGRRLSHAGFSVPQGISMSLCDMCAGRPTSRVSRTWTEARRWPVLFMSLFLTQNIFWDRDSWRWPAQGTQEPAPGPTGPSEMHRVSGAHGTLLPQELPVLQFLSVHCTELLPPSGTEAHPAAAEGHATPCVRERTCSLTAWRRGWEIGVLAAWLAPSAAEGGSAPGSLLGCTRPSSPESSRVSCPLHSKCP